MADYMRYVYTVFQKTESIEDGEDWEPPQEEELGIFESLDDANQRARQTLEGLGFNYMQMQLDQEVYYDDNGCFDMIEGVGDDNVSIHVKKKMIIPSRARTEPPQSPQSQGRPTTTAEIRRPASTPVRIEKHHVYKVTITTLEDEQDKPYNEDTWSRTSQDTYFWNCDETVGHIVAEVCEIGMWEEGFEEFGVEHVTIGNDGLAKGSVEIDEREHDGNLKEVRYEVTRVEMEFVKRPEKKTQENQVEIVKTVWFGDVRREGRNDGSVSSPVLIE